MSTQNPFAEEKAPLGRKVWRRLNGKSGTPKRYSVAAGLVGSALGGLVGGLTPLGTGAGIPVGAFLVPLAVDVWWRRRSQRPAGLLDIAHAGRSSIASDEPPGT